MVFAELMGCFRSSASLAVLSLLAASCGGSGGGGGGSGSDSLDYSVDPRSIGVSANQDGSAPADRVVSIESRNGLVFIDANGHGSSSLVCNAGNCTVTVEFGDPANLLPGEYMSTLDIIGCSDIACANPIAGSPKTVDISYTVVAGTTVTPTALTFNAIESEAVASQSLNIAYGGSGVAAWNSSITYGSGANWLSLTPAAGVSIPATADASVTTLAKGNYQATLLVENQLSGRIVSVPIDYVVEGLLTAVPTRLQFDIDQDSTAPDFELPFTLQVNPGSAFAGVIDWTSASADAWLEVTPALGDTGADPQPLASLVTAELAALGNGTHSTEITFSSTTPNVSDLSIPVTLQLQLPGVTSVSPYLREAGVADSVIIRGSNFSAATIQDVTFGGVSATAFNVVSDTEIRADHGALTAGSHPVGIVASLGITTSAAVLEVLAAPTLTSASIPSTGTKDRMFFDPTRMALYVLKRAAGEIEKHSYAGGSSWTTISITIAGLEDMDFAPDSDSLLVTDGQVIRRLDADSLSEMSRVTPSAANGADSSFLSPREIGVGNDGIALVIMEASGAGTAARPHRYYSASDTFDVPFNVSSAFLFDTYALANSLDRSLVVAAPRGQTGTIYLYRASDATIDTGNRSDQGPVSVDEAASGVLLDGAGYCDGDISLLGRFTSAATTLAGVIAPNGSSAYAYDSAGSIRKFDLSAGCPAFDCPELGMPLALSSLPGDNPIMAISPLGKTLFIAGDDRILIEPAP